MLIDLTYELVDCLQGSFCDLWFCFLPCNACLRSIVRIHSPILFKTIVNALECRADSIETAQIMYQKVDCLPESKRHHFSSTVLCSDFILKQSTSLQCRQHLYYNMVNFSSSHYFLPYSVWNILSAAIQRIEEEASGDEIAYMTDELLELEASIKVLWWNSFAYIFNRDSNNHDFNNPFYFYLDPYKALSNPI